MKLLTTFLALLISTTAIASPRPLPKNWVVTNTAPVTVTAQDGCVGFNLSKAEAITFGKVLVSLPLAIKEKGLEAKFDDFIKNYKIQGNPLNLPMLLKAYGGGCNALAKSIKTNDSCVMATQTEAAALGFVFTLMNDFIVANGASDALSKLVSADEFVIAVKVLYTLDKYIKGTK